MLAGACDPLLAPKRGGPAMFQESTHSSVYKQYVREYEGHLKFQNFDYGEL